MSLKQSRLWFVFLVLCASSYGYSYSYQPAPFGGYHYPKPERLPALNESSAAAGPPPGVQSDYIDDLIEGQKQQILSNVLGVAPASGSASSTNKSPLESPFESSDAKAFRVNRCASCSE